MDKATLRAQAAERRAQAQNGDPYAGVVLASRFPQALRPRPGSTVGGYWPFRSEIDPLPLMRALASKGCNLALPVTPARGSGLPLTFRLWSEADALVPGAFAVHEPSPDAPLAEPDLLLVPLLAFDRTGARLGYGQGHYDRTLAALRRRGQVTAIGAAFAAQEVARLPVEPHDLPLDGIVTESAYIPAMRTPS